MGRQDSLAAEIEAAEKKFLGKPAEEQAPEEPEQKVEPEGKPPEKEKEGITEPKEKPEVKREEPPTEENWKDRFSNYKAHADATIYGLRQQNVAVEEELQEMRKELAEFKVKFAKASKADPYDGLFTDEEKDLVGEETLEMLKRAQRAALDAEVTPLREQLEAERKYREEQERKRLENEKQNLHLTFLQKLERIVPDYKMIDTNKKFIEWMKQVDPDSGYPRVNIFKAAQGAGDVKRVAEFFIEYKELSKPKDSLAKKVTPEGKGAAPPAQPKKNQQPGLSLRTINKFYDDVRRGKYRNRLKEQQEMERKIDNHLRRMGMDRK